MEGYAEAAGINYYAIRREYTERIVEEREWDKQQGASTFRSTLDTLAYGAGEYARAQKLSADEFSYLLDQCLDLVLDYSLALNLYDYDKPDKPWKGWHHRRYIVQDILNDRFPDIEPDTVAQMVTTYLALPFRNQSFERMLVDLLMAQEMYAFGREVRPQLSANTFVGFMKYRLFNAIGWAVFVWIIYAVFDKDWTVPVFWIFVAQSVLAIYLATRPSKPGKLLSAMNAAYCEMNGSGPFSGKHIENRVKAANEVGAVWPSPLYVLLDDINERGGRF